MSLEKQGDEAMAIVVDDGLSPTQLAELERRISMTNQEPGYSWQHVRAELLAELDRRMANFDSATAVGAEEFEESLRKRIG